MGFGHNHEQEHHSHSQTSNKKLLSIALFITVTFMIAEIIGGIIANSLALISDAGHMFSDAFSLALSLIAMRLAARPASAKRTFGFYRFEILAAFVNGVTLAVISLIIFYEAYRRILEPPMVQSGMMIVIAVLGLLANLGSAGILMKGDTKGNLNLRSAFLHVLGDMLGSVGAIVAGILILLFDWYMADPIISIIVGALVLISGWRVTKESVHVLIEGTPGHINVNELNQQLHTVDGVQGIHDLHVWTITSGLESLSCHIVVAPTKNAQEILLACKHMIQERFGINHVTLQLETEELKRLEPSI
ncbi:cation diffusion facilitator family transporter [Desulfitobacterium dichloroeliminans LMG P-21439]|uniref:Cation diffusion facilitator family transporter n=1 Tax=Desulfitobacterium dichloroeliminans (strain LMG P-21439 / DCA1) TaxID=871963 RepID=L0F884_DESDL|nr:cation diffusion facilitator family transporter [Desulfitobacterium dichloroeliminans]AGA68871.1 cation diffusion facilitator family transporter [Desulfitobacterium dichloroeliminans LMG P-21439]